VAIAARDTREEAVRDRGILSQQFSGLGSGGEGQKAASRKKGSAEGDRAAQSENHAEHLSSLTFLFVLL